MDFCGFFVNYLSFSMAYGVNKKKWLGMAGTGVSAGRDYEVVAPGGINWLNPCPPRCTPAGRVDPDVLDYQTDDPDFKNFIDT